MDIMQAVTLMRHMFNRYHAGSDLNEAYSYTTQAWTLMWHMFNRYHADMDLNEASWYITEVYVPRVLPILMSI